MASNTMEIKSCHPSAHIPPTDSTHQLCTITEPTATFTRPTLPAEKAAISYPLPVLTFESSCERGDNPTNKPTLLAKNSFRVEIENGYDVLASSKPPPRNTSDYLIHFPNNTSEHVSLAWFQNPYDYDLNLEVREYNEAVGVISTPKTLDGRNSKIMFRDRVIFNGDMGVVWEIGDVNLYTAENCYVTYWAHNRRNCRSMLVHVPRIWSVEANREERE
jgi:hypothetical protein